ncbi:A/G-specific adenine glycosylase [Chengkuizengella axinellae]|uniref:Adenine DNA glycosylase n=1 Tax=Chengkuizengella axinellae TaxID=3064388 RepID=A0ABT9J0A0_9BACL|nr:A/G-specific adenine glycosylase [Chengkuizengella sp. 2205SS18-9]MDP5275035.1 A/G-specific adenine glycosylase [Chengkuizengella sp. 2205SS18-9]
MTNLTEQKLNFVKELLSWFRENKRDLPWRKNKNPYHIWISEIMLQQTRVDTVIPYFENFIDKFPTIEALANAPEEDVLKAWEGLGYYSRARNLHSAVKEVKASYGSVVPDNPKDISSLKGVGPYTAGAVLSIAYDKPEPAVDGNVMRVLSRYFLIEEDITKVSTRTAMEKIIREIIPSDAASDFNQGLMELGALVCTPKSPKCTTCPVMEHCDARLQGKEEALPIKKKAKPPKLEQRLVAFIEGTGTNEGKILIRQRPGKGLLAGMWELPHYLTENPLKDWMGSEELNEDFVIDQYALETGTELGSGQWMLDINHVFSHILWDMKVYQFTESHSLIEKEAIQLSSEYRYAWISLDEVDEYVFPNVFLRIFKEVKRTK